MCAHSGGSGLSTKQTDQPTKHHVTQPLPYVSAKLHASLVRLAEQLHFHLAHSVQENSTQHSLAQPSVPVNMTRSLDPCRLSGPWMWRQ